jgi:hypothetical protein
MAGLPISMYCTNCGAPLSIADDMERFACGYRGTQLVVERRGGTVALKRIESAIQQVRIGTGKTAAELAVVRLTKELQ